MNSAQVQSAVVIIFYRHKIDWYEKISLLQISKILGNHVLIAICPRDITPIGLQFLPKHVTRMDLDPKWFASRETYNSLLLNPNFYEHFLGYKRILIFQLDAFVFSDQLEYFSSLEYDYIGAPWVLGERIQRYNFPLSIMLNKWICDFNAQLTCYVGNGGFSLRNPAACRQLLLKSSWLERKFSLNEDGFFAFHGSSRCNDFKVAPLEIAVDFAWEKNVEICSKINNNKLPFGCHAWQKGDDQLIRRHIASLIDENLCTDPEINRWVLGGIA